MSAETSNERPSGLVEVWRHTVPGLRAHTVATDCTSDTLLIADGWGCHLRPHLDQVDSDSGQVIATFVSAAPSWFCHVDPRAGMAFALARDETDKGRDVLTAYRLPPHN